MSIGKCVLVNAYSYHNAGDAAIMIASERLMRDLGANEVVLSTRYDDAAEYARHGIRVMPELLRFPARGHGGSGVRLLKFSWAALRGLAIVAVSRVNRSAGKAIASILLPATSRLTHGYSTLVIAGGGYMYSSRRFLNLSLWHSLLTIRVAQALLDNTVMMPQSIGAVNRAMDAKLIGWGLRNTTVVVRERVSFEKSSVPLSVESKARQTFDVAFYLEKVNRAKSSVKTAKLIRVVAMDWRWSSSVREESFAHYIDELASCIDALQSEGFDVELGGHSMIPEHSQDDIAVAKLVASKCLSAPVVDENCDVAHLLKRYGESSAVIGTRLHACIMSISQGTPAIAIAYQEKTSGVMASLGLQEFVFRADSLDATKLVEAVKVVTSTNDAATDELANKTREGIRAFYQEIL